MSERRRIARLMSDTKPSVPSTMKDMMKMFASPANNSGRIQVKANMAAVGIPTRRARTIYVFVRCGPRDLRISSIVFF